MYLLLVAWLISTAACASPGTKWPGGGKTERMSKVAPELVALYDEYSAYLASQKTGPFRPANPLVQVIDDRVVVDAVASGDVDALKSDLVSLGMREAVAFGRIVSGQLPISAIPAMTTLPSLNFARAAAGMVQGTPGPFSPGKPDR